MKTAEELRKKLSEIVTKMRALFDKAQGEERDFTDEENTQYDGWKAEAESLKAQTKRAEALEAEERDLSSFTLPANNPADPQAGNPDDDGGSDESRGQAQVGENRYSRRGEFRSLAHFCHDIYRAGPGVAQPTEALRKWQEHTRAAGSPSQSAGDATAGGVLIPVEFSDIFLSLGIEQSDILSNAMTLPMQSNALDIPFLDGFDESSGKVAGNVVFYWSGEEEQYKASKFKVGSVELRLKKCTGLAFMTAELLKFSPATAEPLLMNAFARGYMKAVTKVCIRGNGVGQPLGVLNSPCLVKVEKEGGQAADTLTVENIVKMFARFYSENESGGGGIWHTNKTTIPQLTTLSLDGSGNSPVFISKMQDSPGWFILGDPVRFSTMMSTLGDEGDILFADWSQYLIGIPAGQNGFEMSQSVHLKYDYDQTTFKFTFYMDGRPWFKEAFKPEHGETMSPYVTLAERA